MEYENLSNEELIKLYRNTRNECVKEYFFDKNFKFAHHIVKKFKMGKGSHNEWEDIISEAYKGLVMAFNSFNTDTKFKFSTYAGKVIYNQILKYLDRLESYKKYRMISISDKAPKKKKKGKVDFIEDTLVSDVVKMDDYVAVMDGMNRFMKRATSQELKVYKLCIQKDMSQREVGMIMNLSQTHVGTILKRVKQKLVGS